MSELIKIGLFSKIAQITVRTLRHYDELDLIKPAYIDSQTNYRFYSFDQLLRIHQIQALKDIGLTLDQIRTMIGQKISIEDTIEILHSQKKVLFNEIDEKNVQLKKIELRLKQLDTTGAPSKYEIVLKQIPSLSVASIRRIVPLPKDIPSYRCKMFEDLESWLDQNQYDILQEYVFYHMDEFIETDFDMEAAVSIQPAQIKIQNDSIITLRNLPAETLVASLVHKGTFMDVGHALQELFTWLGMNEYSPIGPIREIHLFGRENHISNYNDILVELQIPISKNM